MKAVITGASSGIGRELARLLAPGCSELVLAGRDRGRLDALEAELSGACRVTVFSADLTDRAACIRLHDAHPDADLLVNNAGFGVYGPFCDTSLEQEIRMVDVNVAAMHILMKLYLRDMVRRDRGRILNVASIAGFAPGPPMASYYAGKAYVVRLSEAVRTELKAAGSRVRLSVLCPGPVDTGFAGTAGIPFHFGGMDARKAAEYALRHLDRFYIVPGLPFRAARAMMTVLPPSLTAPVIYGLQDRRKG